MDTWAVEAEGLEKSYGGVRVLDGVDLRARAGSVFALLGPNGAGKTTTVRILATLTRPDAGVARVVGLDVVRQRASVRAAISLTGQQAAVDDLQTGEENLATVARLRGAGRAQTRRQVRELLERFDLADAGRQRVGTWSGGMRRRLDLAAGLVGSPSVLFLDEPTTGLDLRSRQALWQVVADLVDAGRTIFLTTQYLEEADRLADQVAVLDGGHVVAAGTPGELKQRVGGHRLDVVLSGAGALEDAVRRLGDTATTVDPATRTLRIATDGSAGQVRALLDRIDPARDAVESFTTHTATLDDVFLALTSSAAGRAAAGAHTSTRETADV